MVSTLVNFKKITISLCSKWHKEHGKGVLFGYISNLKSLPTFLEGSLGSAVTLCLQIQHA